MPISGYAPKLMDVLFRAQIYAEATKIAYFKASIKQELRNAVMYGRPKSMVEAIDIATDVERDLRGRNPRVNPSLDQMQPTAYSDISSGSNSSTYKGEVVQNYQAKTSDKTKDNKKKACFYCKKTGHWKKECRKRQNDLAKKRLQQNTQTKVTEQEEPDFFSHIINRQEVKETKLQAHRFYTTIICKGKGEVKILVDTGSTISSITAEWAEKLGLEIFDCEPIIIRYGSNSVQTTKAQALLSFTLDRGIQTQAKAYVVQEKMIQSSLEWTGW